MSNPYSQGDLTRAEELAYKRGFDAGIAHQKKADPPPKAREMKKQRDDLLAALKALMDHTTDQTYCLSETCGRCQECDARAAIARAEGRP